MRSLANIVWIFAVFTLALPGLEGSLHGKEANWADTKESVATLNPCPISSPEGTNSIAGGTAPGWQPRFDLYRGRCPRLLNLSPPGTRSDED